jgi:lysophospholipase L1-like esterase
VLSLVVAAALLAGPGAGADDGGSEAGLSEIEIADSVRFVGRVRPGVGGSQEFAWSGTGFELDLDGGRLEAVLGDSGETWLEVELNGERRTLDLDPGEHAYMLVDAPPGSYRVRVTRRTEANSGRTVLETLRTDGRATPTEAPARRILVIGDSISAGYGVEGLDRSCPFSFASENANATYAALAARALGADLHTVAASGRGVIRNYGDDDRATMPELYRLDMPGGEVWPSEAFRPHVVVIHLGTNDFAGNDPGMAYIDGYARLLAGIESDYPDARIIASIGPLPDDRVLANTQVAIKRAIAAHVAAGGREASFLTFEWAREGRVFGCDWHPGADTHAAMAELLQRRLEQELGWSVDAPDGLDPRSAIQ